MINLLPPLRFTGARILRDGVLQDRSIAFAEGRITKGPLPAVDLSGYLVLPGVIDMLAAPVAAPGATPLWRLSEADRTGAAHGVTTQFLHQGWSWEGPASTPAAAEAMAAALAQMQPATDLRLALQLEHELCPDTQRLLALLQRDAVDLVLFSNRAGRARAQAEHDMPGFRQYAYGIGHDAESLSLTLAGMAAAAGTVPRALCFLAEQFDRMGIVYGSIEDETAETREHHSMIGAGLCMTPRSHRAAAAARAVCDPVVLAARDVQEMVRTRTFDPEQGVRCNALSSAGAATSLSELVLHLDRDGLLPLTHGWPLISEAPAKLLRLPDRGHLGMGARADLTVVNAASLRVEATIVAGRLAYLSGAAGARFLGMPAGATLAAE